EPHRSRRPRQPAGRRPELRSRRHAQGARAGRRGHPRARPGLPGRRHPPPGLWGPGVVHGPQAQLRRGRRAHLPGPLADHPAHRADGRGRCPPGEALLPARPGRQGRQDQGEARRPL
ncbi:MAG: LSU ribosomal protein L19p, partial [uncultured Acidimicrobiales bacterium]